MPRVQYVRREQKVSKNLLNHVEENIGTIKEGWILPKQNKNIQVVKIEPKDIPESNCFLSIGLSNTLYPLNRSEKKIRLELFLLLPNDHEPSYAPSIIEDAMIEMQISGKAFLRGDVIGPKGEIFENSKMTALYVAPPICFDEKTAGFKIAKSEVIFMWLVPISTTESDYIKRNGWESFEDILENNEIDVLDIFRKPSV